jgi:hypothetical protein
MDDLGKPTLPPHSNEPAVVKYHDPKDIGFDVWRLRSVTADILKHARDYPAEFAAEAGRIREQVKELQDILP